MSSRCLNIQWGYLQFFLWVDRADKFYEFLLVSFSWQPLEYYVNQMTVQLCLAWCPSDWSDCSLKLKVKKTLWCGQLTGAVLLCLIFFSYLTTQVYTNTAYKNMELYSLCLQKTFVWGLLCQIYHHDRTSYITVHLKLSSLLQPWVHVSQ